MTSGKHRILAIAAALSVITVPAQAQAGDLQARLKVRETCILEQRKFDEFASPSGEQESAIVAGLLASFAGALAQSAVSGIAGAIDRASSEKTFKATGTARFDHGMIELDPARTLTPYRYRDKPRCAVLVVPDESRRDRGDGVVPLSDIGTVPEIDRLVPAGETRTAFISAMLDDFGLKRLPLVYIEVALLPDDAGLKITPLMVWYRKALPGASSSKAQRAELHVALATPGYAATGDPLGNVYAFSRMSLPPMRPGTHLRYEDLRFANPIFHAARTPRDADNIVAATYNLKQAKVVTKRAELAKARADLAQAEAVRADTNNAVNRNAVAVMKDAVKAAEQAKDKAESEAGNNPGANTDPLLGHGRTNARMSFLVIRDENRFGKAISGALSAQAEAVGSAVAKELAPSAPWATTDTAFVVAQATLTSAVAARDAALAEGDPVKIAAAEAAVVVAKAKLNEAAIGADKPLPYPDLAD